MTYNWYTFFSAKKILGVQPTLQYICIIVLVLFTICIGYTEFIQYGTTQGYVGYWPSIFFVPIYEEIVFRGVLLALLLQTYSVKQAVIISSILFGLWHLKNIGYVGIEPIISQILYTMVCIGPLFAYITVRTQSILPAIIVHYIHNLLAAYV